MEKKYGLQLPKSKQVAAVKPRAFSLDDDNDDSAPSNSRFPTGSDLASSRAKKFEAAQARVLEDDPNAFSYDEMWDQDQAKKKTVDQTPAMRLGMGSSSGSSSSGRAASAAASEGPRYITALLEKAAQRKLEQEAVYERNLLKEREKDDAQYAGKDKYMTAAFKEKLAEQERLRAKQEAQDKEDTAKEQARMKAGASGFAFSASRTMMSGLTGARPSESSSTPETATSSSSAPKLSFEERAAKRQRLFDADAPAPAPASTPASAAPSIAPSIPSPSFSAQPPPAASSAFASRPASPPSKPTAAAAAQPELEPEPEPEPVDIKAVALATVFRSLTVERNAAAKAESARTRLQALRAAGGK